MSLQHPEDAGDVVDVVANADSAEHARWRSRWRKVRAGPNYHADLREYEAAGLRDQLVLNQPGFIEVD